MNDKFISVNGSVFNHRQFITCVKAVTDACGCSISFTIYPMSNYFGDTIWAWKIDVYTDDRTFGFDDYASQFSALVAVILQNPEYFDIFNVKVLSNE